MTHYRSKGADVYLIGVGDRKANCRNAWWNCGSDIGMPQMDGYMLIRQIRSLTLKLGGRIPAIALTAYVLALCAGFQRHIAKPIDPEAVVTLVACCRRHRPLD